MEAARCGVRATPELAARVKLREDDLDAGEPRLRLDVHRDTAAVVVHLDRAVGVEDHLDVVPKTREGLIDRVVDDLPEAVHEATGIRGTDVHTGTLADSLEPFEDRQMSGGVFRARGHA